MHPNPHQTARFPTSWFELGFRRDAYAVPAGTQRQLRRPTYRSASLHGGLTALAPTTTRLAQNQRTTHTWSRARVDARGMIGQHKKRMVCEMVVSQANRSIRIECDVFQLNHSKEAWKDIHALQIPRVH